MDALFSANAAVQQVVPAVVQRYRAAGVLTRALLHNIEAEVFAQVAATGKYSMRILDMLRAPRRSTTRRTTGRCRSKAMILFQLFSVRLMTHGAGFTNHGKQGKEPR